MPNERDRAEMSAAVDSGRGIRILRQDPFETLISFIISQNNNIPRIKKIISALCERYGERVFSRLADKSKGIFINLKGSDKRLNNKQGGRH